MKILLIFSLVSLACSARLHINRPVYAPDSLRSRTLGDDFNDIKALIPKRQLFELFRRYLDGDEEFRRIILYLGSPDFIEVGKLIRNQPEVREFSLWTQEQVFAGQLNSLADESTSTEFYDILNYVSSVKKPMRGWKGFMEELVAIYPREKICNLIREKVAANGIFTELWNRVTALRPVYERILELPEVRKVIDRLRDLGVDTKQIGQIIRKDFGWENTGPMGSKGSVKLLQSNANQSAGSNQVPIKPLP